MVQLVNKAVMNFVSVGEDIAEENPDFQVSLARARERERDRHREDEIFTG